MAIIFDTLGEFEAFCQSFSLRESASFVKPGPDVQRSSAPVPLKKSAPKPKGKRVPQVANKTQHRAKNSLTHQIKATIDGFIATKTVFAVKDVYARIVKTNKTANQATVLSMTSKLLITQYNHLASEYRPSNGPRPYRVFLP